MHNSKSLLPTITDYFFLRFSHFLKEVEHSALDSLRICIFYFLFVNLHKHRVSLTFLPFVLLPHSFFSPPQHQVSHTSLKLTFSFSFKKKCSECVYFSGTFCLHTKAFDCFSLQSLTFICPPSLTLVLLSTHSA